MKIYSSQLIEWFISVFFAKLTAFKYHKEALGNKVLRKKPDRRQNCVGAE